MSERLHIIMTCTRPKNVERLALFYLERVQPHPFELRWHILQQGPEPDPKGINKVNEALDFIRDGWIVMIADDTEQHPSVFRRVAEVAAEHPDCGAIVFAQDRGGGWILHPAREQMTQGCVCGGQAFWRRSFIGDKRFDYQTYGGRCDGAFIEQMHRSSPERFVFVDEPLMRFGSLEWKG